MWLWAAAGASACFTNADGIDPEDSSRDDGTTHGGEASTAGDRPGDSTGADGAQTDDSSGGPDAECGNGVVEPGEDCDDANNDDSDDCTNACVAAGCSDGLANGGESDVDCGGPCDACPEGSACAADSDCASASCYVDACVPACEPWTLRYGTAGIDAGYAVQVEDEAIYVGGAAGGPLRGETFVGERDAVLSQLSTDGTINFTRQVGGPAAEDALGIDVGSGGFAVLAGQTFGDYDGNAALGGEDAFVTLFDDNTTRLWSVQLGTTGNDNFQNVAFNDDAKIYAAGWTDGSYGANTGDGSRDMLLVKFNEDGTEAWARQLGGANNQILHDVVVDGNEDVIVLGYSDGAFEDTDGAGLRDAVLIKFDGDGQRLWTTHVGGEQSDTALSVAVDGAGDLYIAGSTEGSFADARQIGARDVFVAKVSGADGQLVWASQFGTSTDDEGQYVSVDAEGTVYVTGSTRGDLGRGINQGENDAFVAAVDAEGTLQWSEQFGSAGEDVGRGIAVGPRGEVVFSGYSYGDLFGPNEGESDLVLARVCPP